MTKGSGDEGEAKYNNQDQYLYRQYEDEDENSLPVFKYRDNL